MNIWISTIGEPIPSDGDKVRLLRHGLLADVLLEQGHSIQWWTSAWDHQRKRWRSKRDDSLSINKDYRLHRLKGLGYDKNVSLRRLTDHKLVADKFRKLASNCTPPDIILCSFPTAGMCKVAVEYGKKHAVPVVIDVRDKWPDIFFDLFPKSLHSLVQFGALPMVRENTRVLRDANAIFSMSDDCLNWGLKSAGRGRESNDKVFPLAYCRREASMEEVDAAMIKFRKLGIDPSKRICWYIGTLGKRYDVPTIVEAARAMQESSDEGVQFVISGDGDQAENLKRMASGLKNVFFTGWVQTPEITALMDIADVGIVAINDTLPTLPNKLFEYFAAGIPVVSCVVGEAEKLIRQEQCGIRYEMNNAHSLKKSLDEILGNEEMLSEYGRNALKLYCERYSSEVVYKAMANKLLEVHDSYRNRSQVARCA